MSDSFLVFDVGNSRIKASQARDGKLGPLRAALLADESAFESLLNWPGFPANGQAFISSVNPPASNRLIERLKERGIQANWCLLSDGALFRDGYLRCHTDLAASTGVDRMLSSIAAQHRYPAQAVIVVDCGSAVTVNFTDATGCFQGGAILPGRRLMSQTLSHGTAELPRIEVAVPRAPIGRNTADAITSGVAHAIAGGVRQLIEEFRSVMNAKAAKVLVTGGDAPFVASMLGMTVETAPELVLEGLMLVGQLRMSRQ